MRLGLPLAAVALLSAAGCAGRRTAASASPAQTPAEEIRALWVDAFHAGIRTPQEAEELVATAKRANLNTLVVQVRRRGDALYTKSFEPPLDEAPYDPSFDALAHIIEVAHREGLEVHAWINAMPVWRDQGPPRDPRHVFNLHGPSKSGEENWFTLSPKGEDRFPVGYFLDPGHPAAAAHVAEVYLNIVRHYKVDGIHFDYIRYPETTERLPRGAPVGYNPTALARFRRATGRTGTPGPEEEQWMAWRRQQVTDLVRRVSIEARAVNPRIKVSAALIPWGKPPASEKDFLEVAPGQRIFQDWHRWLKEGLLDLAMPMNYARETDATVRGWFDGWIRWEKKHKHGRQLAVGLGAYLNVPEATEAQVERVRRREGRHRADGVSFFSYANPSRMQPAEGAAGGAPNAGLAPAASPAERLAFLAQGAQPPGNEPRTAPPVFPGPAHIPPMKWMDQPTRGWLAGTVRNHAGQPVDGAVVHLKRTGRLFSRSVRAEADGSGYFGFTLLKPGSYRVWVEAAGKRSEGRVTVAAGAVARVELAVP